MWRSKEKTKPAFSTRPSFLKMKQRCAFLLEVALPWKQQNFPMKDICHILVNNNNNNCTRKIIRFYHQKTNQFFIDSKMSFKLFKILEESREILSRSVMQQQNKIDNHQLKLYWC